MKAPRRDEVRTCEQARREIHRELDVEARGGRAKASLARHLARCSGCAARREELRTVQAALRGLEQPPLPDGALRQVLRRTSRRAITAEASGRRSVRWFAAAAAVVLAAVLVATWWSGRPAGPTERELEQAAVDSRLILRLTAGALRRAEHRAVQKVLVEEVAPALRRIPLRWPSPRPTGGRETPHDA